MAITTKKFGIVTLVIAAILLGLAGAVVWFPNLLPRGARVVQTVKIGGPFVLTDQNGVRFSSTSLQGRPFAIFFGFTHCPDECPETLAELSQAMQALGTDANKLQVLFVTFDPARDTPPVMKKYMEAFDPRILALTGGEAAISAVAKSYYVYWKKVPGKGDDYDFEHSSGVYLIDANGAFAGQVSIKDDRATIIAKLKMLVASGRIK